MRRLAAARTASIASCATVTPRLEPAFAGLTTRRSAAAGAHAERRSAADAASATSSRARTMLGMVGKPAPRMAAAAEALSKAAAAFALAVPTNGTPASSSRRWSSPSSPNGPWMAGKATSAVLAMWLASASRLLNCAFGSSL